MKKNKPFSLNERIRSIKYAFKGLIIFFESIVMMAFLFKKKQNPPDGGFCYIKNISFKNPIPSQNTTSVSL